MSSVKASTGLILGIEAELETLDLRPTQDENHVVPPLNVFALVKCGVEALLDEAEDAAVGILRSIGAGIPWDDRRKGPAIEFLREIGAGGVWSSILY